MNLIRLAERSQRRRDRIALRTYERLRQDPTSYRTAPSTTAAVLVSGTVVIAAIAAVAGLAWATLHASGFGWFMVALGWACLFVARPRVPRLGPDAVVVDVAVYPGIHQLVREMAAAVGVRPPQVIAVDLELNAAVAPVGWRGRNAMVLGLPLLSLGSWPERLGTIGHELGHLRGRDTMRLRLVAAAEHILGGMQYLLAPDPDPMTRGLLEDLSRVLQFVLVLPVICLGWLLHRVRVASGQHREYLADRRAAEVVGSTAMAATFLYDYEAILIWTRSSAHRGENPFETLLGRPLLTPQESAERMRILEMKSARSDATHPLDHLRIKLIQAPTFPPSPVMPAEPTWHRAEADLVRLRAEMAMRFAEKLIHNY